MVKTKPHTRAYAGCNALLLSTALASSVLLPQHVRAADTSTDDQSPQLKEIVVTGTLIRGVAPIGTNVISITNAQVEATGATTTAQLLQTIPQMGVFNNLQTPSNAFNDVTTDRPNLRNLPGFNTSGSSSTLVLVDGHRVVGMGIQSTSPDPDIIPPDMIERIEVVPDGGSAIYGSDAVAGVINFITRKDFNGVEAGGQYGFADHYKTFDANLTAGHGWGSGSAFLSYNYVTNTALTGGDLGYVRTPLNSYAGLTSPALSLECNPGNVQLLAGSYISSFSPLTIGSRRPPVSALPFATGTAVPNTANQCDPTKEDGVYPEEHRYSIFTGVTQNWDNGLAFDLRGFYMNRWSELPLGQFPNSTLIGPPPYGTASPFQASHLSYPGDVFELQQVYYTVPGNDTQFLHLSTWGVTPTLTADLGGGWELRSMINYGQSLTQNDVAQPDTTALGTAIGAGLFNPYDPASSDPGALSAIANYQTYGEARQTQADVREVLDGSLFRLPGGSVKTAVGLEYDHETFDSQTGTIVPGTQNSGFAGLSIGGVSLIAPYAAIPTVDLARSVESAFAELDVPIVGEGNRFPGMDQLTFSASGRYDHYSDFGGTSNPKLGLNYKPIDWFNLRGSWGRSFVAPSLADNSLTTITSANVASTAAIPFLLPPANLIANGTYAAPEPGRTNDIILLGTHPNIQPETARTFSVGFDVQPPVVPNLRAGVTYWHLDFDDVVAVPNFTDQAQFWTYFGPLITVNPTAAQVAAAEAQANEVVGTGTPSSIYAILDARKNNTGDYRLDGLDFDISYVYDTRWGSIDFDSDADYDLHREQSPFAGSPFAPVPNTTDLQVRTSVGVNIGNLRAQVTDNHTAGFTLIAPVGVDPVQYSIASFDTVDLFFSYDLDGKYLLRNVMLTLSVSNVLDRNPPDYEAQSVIGASSGYLNGATLGRLIELGINKKF